MIIVTKLDNREIVINSECIEMIESTPDTTVTMTTGRKIILRDSVEEVLEKIIQYKKSV